MSFRNKDNEAFNAAIQLQYMNNLRNNQPFLEEKQWTHLAKSFNLCEKDFLFSALDFGKQFSQSLISHYAVGAIGLGVTNRLYFGANIEFPQFPLNQAIHAEQSLISVAYMQNEISLKEIYLTAFPCGHCRQFFREMINYEEVKIYVSSVPTKEYLLPELLPFSFGPQDLNVTESLFQNKESFTVKQLLNFPQDKPIDLKEKILLSLNKSFAPYSLNSSGLVIIFDNGTSILGSCIESCAYNPSLSALHVAYAQIVLSKLDPKKIKEVYFIERKNTLPTPTYDESTRKLLQLISPQAKYYSLEASI